MEIARIEPNGQLRIDFSEKLMDFDFFKNMDIDDD